MTLHLGDCNTILEKLTDQVFDALITDPPYGLCGNKQTNKEYGKMWKEMEKWDKEVDYNWLDKAIPLLKDSANIVIFTDWRKISHLVEKLESLGCSVKELIRYEKSRGTNPFTASYRFVCDCEYAVWAVKGQHVTYTFHKFDNKQVKPRIKAVLYKSERKNGKHPTQKPYAVGRFIIEHLTNEGDTILDPFAGSASFGVAAVSLGRKYVGIEISEDYYKLAESNIRDRIEDNERIEEIVKVDKPIEKLEKENQIENQIDNEVVSLVK